MAVTIDPRLARAANRAVTDYLAVRPDEQVVILLDDETSKSIPVALQKAVAAVGAEPILVSVVPRVSSGTDLPKAVLSAVAAASVVISVCSRSPYHSSLKVVAQEAGVRGALNSPAHEYGWLDGAMHCSYPQLRPVADRLRSVLAAGSWVEVRSPSGTDLTLSIEGRDAVGWLTGMATEPCQTVAWPGGEVSLPPVEGTAEGRVVVEVAMTDIGGLREPIAWTVSKGLAREITGGEEADRLRAIVDVTPNAQNMAELGIGINPLARLGDDITEAKKRRGTIHLALGDSANGYGGAVECALHLDGLVVDPTVTVDGQVILRDGTLEI